MIGDIIGGLLGGEVGARVRGRVIARRYRRARSGGDVRVAAKAHLLGMPEWREARGVLRRRAGALSWRPRLTARIYSFTVVPPRRWKVREFNLADAFLVGTRRSSSASKGDRVTIELGRVAPLRALSVQAESWPTAELLLRRA